jgi:CRP-like cAMP-binding protein
MTEYKPIIDIIARSKNKQLLTIPKDTPLFSENEPSLGVYFLLKGKAKIVKFRGVQSPLILHLAKNGELLGVDAAVNKHPHSNSAVMISESSIYFIPSEEFLDIINSDIEYKLHVMKLLCSTIDVIEEHISSISERSATERFAETILLLEKSYGITRDNFVNIELNVDELANLTGTTKSYMSKILSEFCTMELIEFNNNRLKILNLSQLEQISH